MTATPERCVDCGGPRGVSDIHSFDHDWQPEEDATVHSEWCAVWGGACDCRRYPPAGLPVGAYVASALMAAGYGGDSGEDVDRFLSALRSRGYAVVALPVGEASA